MKALFAQSLLLIFEFVRTSDGFSPAHSHLHFGLWATTGSSTPSRPLLHSRILARPTRRSQQDDYFEEEEEDRIFETREAGGSLEEQELRNVKYQEDLSQGEDPVAYYQRTEDYEDQEDEYLDDEFIEEDEGDIAVDNDSDLPETGNYWSNPKRSLDPYPDVPAAPRRRSRPMPPSTALPRRRPSQNRGSRTTFRSGTPPTSDAFTEFYDRLFWYGMDEEDGDWVPKGYDKTVFGGTRGKFDALAYLEDGNDLRPPPRRIKRRLPPDNEREDNFDEMEDESYDRPMSNDAVPPSQRAPARRQRRRQAGFDFEERPSNTRKGGRDRVESEVSTWFEDDEEEDDDDYDSYQEENQRPPRRRRSREPTRNPITQFLDGLLDVDREDMQTKAELYEQNLGRRPMPRQQPRRRRAGYAYTFDEEDSSVDGFGDVIDIEEDESADTFLQDDVIVDVEVEAEEKKDDQAAEAPKPRMSWEERSRRLERVPPAGIPAWGPSGDLGIDARTKAMLDGMEELREVRALVEEKAERTTLARDEIVILRADAALETKKQQGNPRRARERLRQIQLDIEDAARDLRRAQKEESFIRQRLEILQDKHWAVLSVYDADKASQVVDKTLSEFSQQEPAARTETPAEGTTAVQEQAIDDASSSDKDN